MKNALVTITVVFLFCSALMAQDTESINLEAKT